MIWLARNEEAKPENPQSTAAVPVAGEKHGHRFRQYRSRPGWRASRRAALVGRPVGLPGVHGKRPNGADFTLSAQSLSQPPRPRRSFLFGVETEGRPQVHPG